MVRWQRCVSLGPAAALLLGAAGCAAPREQRTATAQVVTDLTAAVRAGDGAAACRLLAPDTRDEVAQSAGRPCAAAILDQDLPATGTAVTVDVYGQWARVVTGADTVFLGAFGDGWRVAAAGCSPRGERPYDCRVRGA